MQTRGDKAGGLWSDEPGGVPIFDTRSAASMGMGIKNRWLAFWFAITAPAEPPADAPFRLRERARRGRLLSVIFLGFAVILAGAFYQYLVVDDDHPLMVAVLCVALSVAVAAAVLNRVGMVTLAGALMALVAEAPLAGPFAATKDGQIDILHLGAFYLTVGALLVAASVLSPWSVFPVAMFNSLASLVILASRPHTPALAALLASNDGQQAFFGPIVMQVIVAIIAYLWAQNTLSALRRADRAEEIAALERREVEQQRELEEGVRQLLAVHVALANGDFTARVTRMRSPLLWQVGRSLNTLVDRLVRYTQAVVMLQREQEEAQRLAQTLLRSQLGQPTQWPAPAGLPLDVVIAALRSDRALPGAGAAQALVSEAGEGRSIAGEDTSRRSLPSLSNTTTGNAIAGVARDPRADLPDWLRP